MFVPVVVLLLDPFDWAGLLDEFMMTFHSSAWMTAVEKQQVLCQSLCSHAILSLAIWQCVCVTLCAHILG